MAATESSPLPTSIVRGLTDKLVERRKGAALELERSELSEQREVCRREILHCGRSMSSPSSLSVQDTARISTHAHTLSTHMHTLLHVYTFMHTHIHTTPEW